MDQHISNEALNEFTIFALLNFEHMDRQESIWQQVGQMGLMTQKVKG